MYPLFACSSTLFSQLTGTAIICLLPLVVLILFEAKLINAPREDKPFGSLKYITVINLIAALSAISIIFIIDHEIKHTENGNGIIILFFWLALPLLLIGIEYITYQGECKNISKRKLLTSLIIINIISYITFSALTIFICSVSSRGYPKSTRISCTSNLFQIGLCLKQYAADHDGYLPDKGLKQLHSNDYLTDIMVYKCPFSKTQKSKLNKESIDYIYRSGLKINNNKQTDYSKIPVVWDKLTNHKGYGNVLFLDGHVMWFKGKNWMEQAGIKKGKQNKEFSDLIDKLDKLGYYRYTESSKHAKIKAECKEAGYIYGWDDTKRDYFADAEELTGAGVVNFINEVKPFLKLQGVKIDSVKHNFPNEEYLERFTYEEQIKIIPKRYIVTVNGKEFIIWTEKETKNKEFDIWQHSTERTLDIINFLLKEANSKERAFQLFGGNEQKIIFLTNEMAKLIYASKYIDKNDKPVEERERNRNK